LNGLNQDEIYMEGTLRQPKDNFDLYNWTRDDLEGFALNTYIRKYNGTGWGQPEFLLTPDTSENGQHGYVSLEGFDAKGQPFFTGLDSNYIPLLIEKKNGAWIATSFSTIVPNNDALNNLTQLGYMDRITIRFNKNNDMLLYNRHYLMLRNKNGWQTKEISKGYGLRTAYLDNFGQVITLLGRSADTDPLNPSPNTSWPYIMVYTPTAGWSKPLRVPFERAAHAYPGIKDSPIHWPYMRSYKLLANEHGDTVLTWVTERDATYGIIQSIVMPIEQWNKLK
jgi:hypothetical protein